MPARNVKGRLVYWKISQSQQLSKVSVWAKLLFTWLIPNVDNLGRTDANPHIIKGTIFPLDEEITPKRCSELIKELHGAGLIILYNVKGLDYLCIPKITSYQKLMGRMTEMSDFPGPGENDIKAWEQGFNEVYTGTYQVRTKYVPKVKVKVKVKVNKKSGDYALVVDNFFNTPDLKWLKTLQEAYPKTDLSNEFKKMRVWLISNQSKPKTNFKRFAVNWLNNPKPQIKPGSVGAPRITDMDIEKALGKIATKDMIKKFLSGIDQNNWWLVERFLNTRYPGDSGNNFIQAKRELCIEQKQNQARLGTLTAGIGRRA